jgi:hypothetical protein
VRYSRNKRNGEYTKGRMEHPYVIDGTQFSRDNLRGGVLEDHTRDGKIDTLQKTSPWSKRKKGKIEGGKGGDDYYYDYCN